MDKQRSAIFKRTLAWLLALALMLGTLPDMMASAEGGDSAPPLGASDMITNFDVLPEAVATPSVAMDMLWDDLALADTLDTEADGTAVAVPVTLANQAMPMSLEAGEFSISGLIWDWPDSGSQRVVIGAAIELYDDNGRVGETTSGGLWGTYTFTDLAPGEYMVKVLAGTYYCSDGQNHYYSEASIIVTVDDEDVTQNFRLDRGGITVADITFDTVQTDYGQPAAKPIVITNHGMGSSLFLLDITIDSGDIFEIIDGNHGVIPDGGGTKEDWTIRPRLNLPAGIYTAQIDVWANGSGNPSDPAAATASATVTFKVTGPSLTTVSVGNQSGILMAGTASSVTFPVITTGIADGSYHVSAANLPTGVVVQGDVAISNNAGTLTLAGDTTTSVGTYNNLTLTIGGATSAAFQLTIIDPSKTYTISASPGFLNFGIARLGYAEHNLRMVTVENTGTGSVTLTQPTSTNYDIVALGHENIEPGETTSFQLRPKTGLAVGSYNETITISGSGGATASVNLGFNVINNDSSRNSSNSDSSGGGSYAVSTVTKAKAEKLMKEAQDKGYISIRFSGQIFVTAEAWEVFAVAGIDTEGGSSVSTLADALAAWNANPCQENGDALLSALFTTEGLALAENNPELQEALKFFGGAQTYAEAKQMWDTLANKSYADKVVKIASAQAAYFQYMGLTDAEYNELDISLTTDFSSIYYESAAKGDYEAGAFSVVLVATLKYMFSDLNKNASAAFMTEIIKSLEQLLAQAKSEANAPLNALAAALAGITPQTGAVVEVNTTGSPVQVRVTVYQPGKMKTGMYVSGAVKGSAVNSVKSAVNQYFTNDIHVISLDYKGEWGQVVRVTAKVDLSAWEGDKPVYFYAYDKEANTYRRIRNAAPRLDADGYLHFNTQYGGEIIVSEGELEKKADVSGTAPQLGAE